MTSAAATPPHARSGRATRLRLIALLLLAFAIATFALDYQSLWYDEGVTAMVAQQNVDELTRWTAGDIQPPLYYYVVAAWGRLAGWSEWALRVPSAWFGTLSVALVIAVGRRLGRSERIAVLVGLLAALHPLLVYYAQEARMYAQLTALSVLLVYLLLRIADTPAPRFLAWALFVTAATAAVYTHYFAAFLLIALTVAFVIDTLVWQPRAHWGRKLLGLLFAGITVLLLYLPWLGALTGQLSGDRSYWAGALKLNEALGAVARSFTSGETVFERTAWWLLIGYGLVTVFAVWRLWRGGANGRRVLLYTGSWLVGPVAAVLLLALAIPKFNARYVMEALPALLLLWAGGLTLGDSASAFRFAPRAARAATLFLLLGFFLGVTGWFFNPAFAKEQWRHLVEFLRVRIAEDETVVLVSGHAWPVWDYYAPDLPPVRLPALEVLDVDAVLDFSDTGPVLQEAFADETGLRGAWLVNWQDEVVDPNGIAPIQLELSGREKGQSARFHGLDLRRFTGLRPQRFADAPPIDVAADISFGEQVTLRGYKIVNNGDLLLFWTRPEGAPDPAPDLYFTLTSTSADGAALASVPGRRLAGYTYPLDRWQPGEIVTAHVRAADWLAAAEPEPGRYGFAVTVYDANDPGSAPLVTDDGLPAARFGPVEVAID